MALRLSIAAKNCLKSNVSEFETLKYFQGALEEEKSSFFEFSNASENLRVYLRFSEHKLNGILIFCTQIIAISLQESNFGLAKAFKIES